MIILFANNSSLYVAVEYWMSLTFHQLLHVNSYEYYNYLEIVFIKMSHDFTTECSLLINGYPINNIICFLKYKVKPPGVYTKSLQTFSFPS